VLTTFTGESLFHRGGTLTADNSNPVPTRGLGMGTWTAARSVTLAADAQSLTATIAAQLLDTTGAVLRPICGTGTGVRVYRAATSARDATTMEFLIRAVTTAAIVALVPLATRRFGHRVAGVLAGLPFTTVPALGWTAAAGGTDLAVGSVGFSPVPVFARCTCWA
jgi:hypothetical protein